METLGMLGAELPDTDVLERAKSISLLYGTNHEAALGRAAALLQYMDNRLSTSPDIFSKNYIT